MTLHDSEPYPMSSGVLQRINSQKSSTGLNKTNDTQDGTLDEWLLDMLSNHPSHVRRAFQGMCQQMAQSLDEMGQERRFISERANSSQLAQRLREGVVHLPSVQGVSGHLFKSRHTWPIDASSLRECLDQVPGLSSRLGGILSNATYGQCKGDPIDSATSRFGTHFVSQVLACLSLGTTLYEPMGSRLGGWFVERVEAQASRTAPR